MKQRYRIIINSIVLFSLKEDIVDYTLIKMIEEIEKENLLGLVLGKEICGKHYNIQIDKV